MDYEDELDERDALLIDACSYDLHEKIREISYIFVGTVLSSWDGKHGKVIVEQTIKGDIDGITEVYAPSGFPFPERRMLKRRRQAIFFGDKAPPLINGTRVENSLRLSHTAGVMPIVCWQQHLWALCFQDLMQITPEVKLHLVDDPLIVVKETKLLDTRSNLIERLFPLNRKIDLQFGDRLIDLQSLMDAASKRANT